jgi:hypothetical protein
MPTKTNKKKIFCLLLFEGTFTTFFKDPDPEPDPYLLLMDQDPDPGGPKTCGPVDPEHCLAQIFL